MQAMLAIVLAVAAIAIVVAATSLTSRVVERYKLDSWIVGFVGGLVISPLAVFLAFVFFISSPRPDVPLTADLPTAQGERSAAFDARVKDAFPLGTSEASLTDVLKAQQFVRDDWSSSVDAEHEAIWRRGGPNGGRYRVFWRVDASDRIAAVRGVYCRISCD